MASVIQLVGLLGLVAAVCLIWGFEWAVLVGSAATVAVGVALERPGDG